MSCIKQFWNPIAIKQVNDVTRFQALVDKKKVVVTEAAIREGMLVGQEIEEGGDEEEHVKDVTAGDATQKDDTAAHGEVHIAQPQPQPQQAVDFLMSLLQEALDAYAALTRRAENLEYDKVDQALEITKLNRSVKKLDKGNRVRVMKLRRLKRVGTSQRIDTSDDTVMDDESNQGRIIDETDKEDDVVALMDDKEEDKKDEEAKEDEPAKVQEVVDVVTTAKLITEVVTASSETVTTPNTIISTTEPQVLAATITDAPAKVAAAPSKRRKGVVIRDPEEESTTSLIIPAETKSKDKGKGTMDVAIDHVKLKAKEDPVVKRYQAMKRKPQTEARARKNIMMYLKNVASFRLGYFKGMSYDDIQEESKALQRINESPVERAAKIRKLDEEVEDLKRHLEIMPNKDDDVYTEATPLTRKVPVVDYKIIELNNKPYYKIVRANGTHQLYISFLTLLKNFDREDLEALWNLVKERFSTSKPENFLMIFC
uniref:Uncharacterized protein n=1 Tax=Tanacetum cinerariifolium TaxID=118510 RepID=A0A699JQE0_TANCI|nr:hypothetical protein [Tanacetum cinerariifolium]